MWCLEMRTCYVGGSTKNFVWQWGISGTVAFPVAVWVQDRGSRSWPRVVWGWLSLLYLVFTIPFVMRGSRAVQPLFFRVGSI